MRASELKLRSPSTPPRDRSPSPPSRRRRSITPSQSNGEPVPAPAATSALAKLANSNGANGNGTDSNNAEFAKLLGSRSGGAYIPPARLRAMQAEAAKDKTSAEYQRLSWDALRKSINGMINKVRERFCSTTFSYSKVLGQHLIDR